MGGVVSQNGILTPEKIQKHVLDACRGSNSASGMRRILTGMELMLKKRQTPRMVRAATHRVVNGR